METQDIIVLQIKSPFENVLLNKEITVQEEVVHFRMRGVERRRIIEPAVHKGKKQHVTGEENDRLEHELDLRAFEHAERYAHKGENDRVDVIVEEADVPHTRESAARRGEEERHRGTHDIHEIGEIEDTVQFKHVSKKH